MNIVVLVGNIAGDIYSGTHNRQPFTRLLLLSGRPRLIMGLRTVLLAGREKELCSSLRKGSEIGVIGHEMTRQHDRSCIVEVEARNLVLLRNFSWAGFENSRDNGGAGRGQGFC